MRDYGVIINNIAKVHGRNQDIIIEGISIPLILQDGMHCIGTRKPTLHELSTCTVLDISDDSTEWDPQLLNHHNKKSNEYNNTITTHHINHLNYILSNTNEIKTKTKESNWGELNKYLLFIGEHNLQKTWECTTRLGKVINLFPMKKHLISRNPMMSLPCVHEQVATDTIFSTITSYEGHNCAQFFVRVNTRYQDIFGIERESQGPDVLKDYLRKNGVPIFIRRDNSRM